MAAIPVFVMMMKSLRFMAYIITIVPSRTGQ